VWNLWLVWFPFAVLYNQSVQYVIIISFPVSLIKYCVWCPL
jgi:hypothetical protein